MHQRIDDQPDYASMVKALLEGGHTTHSLAMALGLSQPSVSRLATGRTSELGGNAAVKLIRLAGGEVNLPFLETSQAGAQEGAPPVPAANANALEVSRAA